MHQDLPWSGAVSDDPQTFADMAAQLYTCQVTWQSAVNNGDTIIEQLYDKNQLGDLLLAKIETVETNLASHRLANFSGAMLRHHAHKSTKYMAQWIEAKNKIIPA